MADPFMSPRKIPSLILPLAPTDERLPLKWACLVHQLIAENSRDLYDRLSLIHEEQTEAISKAVCIKWCCSMQHRLAENGEDLFNRTAAMLLKLQRENQFVPHGAGVPSKNGQHSTKSSTVPSQRRVGQGLRFSDEATAFDRHGEFILSSCMDGPGSLEVVDCEGASPRWTYNPPAFDKETNSDCEGEETHSVEGSSPAFLDPRPCVASRSPATATVTSFSQNEIAKPKPIPMPTTSQVFPDAAQMRKHLTDCITMHRYDVTHCYSTSGWCQLVARSPIWEHCTLAVITLNAVWIGLDLDRNKPAEGERQHLAFTIADNLFCSFFTLELFFRFGAFLHKIDAWRDSWFVFDFLLLALMIFETWIIALLEHFSQSGGGITAGDTAILKIFRLVRLTRMARIIRLLRAFPELVVLVKALSLGLRSVLFTGVLMLVFTYVFAILLTQISFDTESGRMYYHTVPKAMKTLLVSACFPDVADMIEGVSSESVIGGIMTVAFLFVVGLTMLNMLVGLLTHVVMVVSEVEKEAITVAYITDNLVDILEQVDVDGDGIICRSEFEAMIMTPHAMQMLNNVNIDIFAMVEVMDFIFKDDKTYTPVDLIQMLLQLRGDQDCTVKDVINLRQFLDIELSCISRKIDCLTMHGTECAPRISILPPGGAPRSLQ